MPSSGNVNEANEMDEISVSEIRQLVAHMEKSGFPLTLEVLGTTASIRLVVHPRSQRAGRCVGVESRMRGNFERCATGLEISERQLLGVIRGRDGLRMPVRSPVRGILLETHVVDQGKVAVGDRLFSISRDNP